MADLTQRPLEWIGFPVCSAAKVTLGEHYLPQTFMGKLQDSADHYLAVVSWLSLFEGQ